MGLSGTERAGYRLALGILRRSLRGRDGCETAAWYGLADARDALCAGGIDANALGFPFPPPVSHLDAAPVLRARVCLFIRAVLRAERGDEGGFALLVECRDEREVATFPMGRMASAETVRRLNARGDFKSERRDRAWLIRLARPLWLDARGVER